MVWPGVDAERREYTDAERIETVAARRARKGTQTAFAIARGIPQTTRSRWANDDRRSSRARGHRAVGREEAPTMLEVVPVGLRRARRLGGADRAGRLQRPPPRLPVEAEPEEREAPRQGARKKARKRRAELPFVEKKISIPDEDRGCEACGGTDLHALGEGEVNEQIEFIPPRTVRIRWVREKLAWACGKCILLAPLPPQVREGCHVDPTHLGSMFQRVADQGMWTFITASAIFFTFDPTRSAKVPDRVLGKSEGVLNVDGYSGYNTVTVPEKRRCAGYWSHARRKFFACRKNHGHVVDWLSTVDPPGRTPLYEAVTYARKQWAGLLVFLEQPKFTLDDNGAERRQRAVAQGRRSWSSRAPTAALSRPPPCSLSSAPARSSASTPTGGSATRSRRRPPFVRASSGLTRSPRA